MQLLEVVPVPPELELEEELDELDELEEETTSQPLDLNKKRLLVESELTDAISETLSPLRSPVLTQVGKEPTPNSTDG